MNIGDLIGMVVAVFGVGGLFWAVLNSSRKRPSIVLQVKGHGIQKSKDTKDSHDIYFSVLIKNRGPEKNSIDKLIFTIWNSRKTEFIWEAWHVELFEPNKETNWTGNKIDLPLVLDGKQGVNAIAVLTMPDEVFYRYLGDRIPDMLSKTQSYEKPFPYKLILRDSFEIHYTGDLNTNKTSIVDYTSLHHMSKANIDMKNDAEYGRPRIKHILGFYLGRLALWIRFKILIVLYYLGLVTKV